MSSRALASSENSSSNPGKASNWAVSIATRRDLAEADVGELIDEVAGLERLAVAVEVGLPGFGIFVGKDHSFLGREAMLEGVHFGSALAFEGNLASGFGSVSSRALGLH